VGDEGLETSEFHRQWLPRSLEVNGDVSILRPLTPFVTTKSRGTGLGLSTVKRLVEAHHGTIHVVCPPEGGTTVVISLPLAPA
jgi:two-component system sensor histidine kinase PilS (NtrC family)